MSKVISEIEGIGPVYSEKLAAAGVSTVEALLEAGSKPAGRKKLEGETGISGALVLRWVNMADLFRIKGVGEEYSDLLEAAGVDTVVELATRNAENLTKKMAEVNAEKNLVRGLPGLGTVETWVAEAKTLDRGVFF